MTTNGRGGARRGAGRPVADIQLDTEAAADLRRIMRFYGLEYDREKASAYVTNWIKATWAAIDTDIQEDAEKEGHVL